MNVGVGSFRYHRSNRTRRLHEHNSLIVAVIRGMSTRNVPVWLSAIISIMIHHMISITITVNDSLHSQTTVRPSWNGSGAVQGYPNFGTSSEVNIRFTATASSAFAKEHSGAAAASSAAAVMLISVGVRNAAIGGTGSSKPEQAAGLKQLLKAGGILCLESTLRYRYSQSVG